MEVFYGVFLFLEKIICGYDGIGRRAGFRFLCREACGFESHYPQEMRTGCSDFDNRGGLFIVFYIKIC